MSSVPSTRALRHSLRRAASCSRYTTSRPLSTFPAPPPEVSTNASSSKLDVQPKTKLPDEKMRVLVGLYHQAGTFITKETLSERIDEAFVHRSTNNISQLGAETPFHALETMLQQRRALPKFGERNAALARSDRAGDASGQLWSDWRTPRERAVMTTLYGVLHRARPGLDSLKDKEEEEEAQKQSQADRKESL
ncbi:hypothetical protein C8Q77DRAFT_394162 [Trametes polyzona]|nr:hypothetical protein C8Q77DRAFT_394162 [Trametes polyzona]